jgi:UDP-N-acetylmuramoyl-tripeptide--D-alanyl-D-alanine ligase
MFKKIITKKVAHQAQRLIEKRHPKIIAVTGSVGKTSTRDAIQTVLSKQFRVMASKGNYNTELAVPLTILGLQLPKKVRNPFAWIAIYLKAKQIVMQPYNYDVVVVELGSDHPGDIAAYASYIHPDINVVTAVSEEHMEFFKTIDAVAEEEFTITAVSGAVLINRDDIDKKFDRFNSSKKLLTYGLTRGSDYRFAIKDFTLHYGFDGTFSGEGIMNVKAQVRVVGTHNIKPAVAAVGVAQLLGVPIDAIMDGVADIEPLPGRMNLLRGAEGSIIIDDSYNSSPLAVKAALQTLYDFQTDTDSRIALLGSMNELGDTSEAAHKAVGTLCDPSELDWVVTVGEDANKYLAPAAQAHGCRVKTFTTPYEAGAFVRSELKPGTVVLAKGSQNHVYIEEAVKLLLADSNDEKQLVRQSTTWLERKQKLFRDL